MTGCSTNNIHTLLPDLFSSLLSLFLTPPVVLLPSRCVMLYYMFDAQLFFQPQPILHSVQSLSQLQNSPLRQERLPHREHITRYQWLAWQPGCDSINHYSHKGINVKQINMSYSFYIRVYFHTLLLLFVWLASKLVMIPGPTVWILTEIKAGMCIIWKHSACFWLGNYKSWNLHNTIKNRNLWRLARFHCPATVSFHWGGLAAAAAALALSLKQYIREGVSAPR